MLTPLEAYRRVLRNDPTFKLEGGVDYDHEYYVFTGPLDMYAVDKRLGTVVAFVPTTDMKKYFDAVKRRPLDISSLQHSDNNELYLEHFGIKNMKWGVRRFQNKDGSLTEAGKKRYGSGNDGEELSGGGGGGGAPEEDEEMKKKIEEAAKKAGMTVAEYRKKMGSKLYDLFGGKYKKEAEKQRNMASAFNSEAQKHAREYDKQKAIAASESRKSDKAETSGDFRKHVNNENVARTKAKTSSARKTQAENARLHSVIDANKAQDKYEKSIAGRYDKLKATMAERGKAKKKEASEQKRKGRTDQYIARPEQDKNTKHLLDTEYSISLRRGAERKSRDVAIFGKEADELKRKQASALGKGLKAKADYYGKQVDWIEKTSSEQIMGRRDWKGDLRDSAPNISVRDSKRAYDKTAQGKLDKARYAVQRTKQRVKNTLEARGSSQIPTKNSSPDQSPTNRPVSREKTKRAVKGSIKVGERRHRSTTSQQGIKQGEKHEGLRTHTLPKMKSLTATAKPMRKLTSKELSKIRSEARVKQLKKDGDYTGEYKKKRRK